MICLRGFIGCDNHAIVGTQDGRFMLISSHPFIFKMILQAKVARPLSPAASLERAAANSCRSIRPTNPSLNIAYRIVETR